MEGVPRHIVSNNRFISRYDELEHYTALLVKNSGVIRDFSDPNENYLFDLTLINLWYFSSSYLYHSAIIRNNSFEYKSKFFNSGSTYKVNGIHYVGDNSNAKFLCNSFYYYDHNNSSHPTFRDVLIDEGTDIPPSTVSFPNSMGDQGSAAGNLFTPYGSSNNLNVDRHNGATLTYYGQSECYYYEPVRQVHTDFATGGVPDCMFYNYCMIPQPPPVDDPPSAEREEDIDTEDKNEEQITNIQKVKIAIHNFDAVAYQQAMSELNSCKHTNCKEYAKVFKIHQRVLLEGSSPTDLNQAEIEQLQAIVATKEHIAYFWCKSVLDSLELTKDK